MSKHLKGVKYLYYLPLLWACLKLGLVLTNFWLTLKHSNS